MVNLNTEDKKNLLNLLLPLPILAQEKGREAVFVSADLEELRPQVDLSGPSIIVIPLLLNFLCSYGRLSYEQEALGRFLNTIQSYVGAEQKDFLNGIIAGYGLMTPVAKSPLKIDWILPVKSEDILEKIIGENTLRPIAFLQQGLDASRSIAYIEVSLDEGWSGTGFMISPNLLITNHHVISTEKEMVNAIFRFNYQLDARGNPQAYKDYFPVQGGIFYANSELDYAIVEIKNSPGDEWGYLRLKSEIPMNNSRVNIIQHPNGLPKQISIQNNFTVFADATKIQYVTSTQPGSSGSPVFSDDWQVIGLHHAGGWLSETDEGPLYFRNEGIAIQAIVEDIPKDISDELTKAGNK